MFVNLYAFLSLTGEQWKPLLVMLTHTVIQRVLGKRDGEKNLPFKKKKLQQFWKKNSCHQGSSRK